jgi:hypothetical protein
MIVIVFIYKHLFSKIVQTAATPTGCQRRKDNTIRKYVTTTPPPKIDNWQGETKSQ